MNEKQTQILILDFIIMGKIEAQSIINHFSHPHPLNLISLQSKNRITCSACKREASGLIYTCAPCNYSLHKPCSNMPQTLTHQADKKHTLILLSTPAYEDGSFKCNACGALGTGFCYHCPDCQLDLHTVCAFMRSSVKGPAHEHPLELFFEPPYENKAFACDVCGGSGLNHWVYRCDPCGFDAHLKCAKRPISKIQRNQMDLNSQSFSSTINYPVSTSAYADQYVTPGPESLRQLHGYQTAPVYPTQGFVQGPTRHDSTMENVVQSLIEGLVEGAANQLGQALLQGGLGN